MRIVCQILTGVGHGQSPLRQTAHQPYSSEDPLKNSSLIIMLCVRCVPDFETTITDVQVHVVTVKKPISGSSGSQQEEPDLEDDYLPHRMFPEQDSNCDMRIDCSCRSPVRGSRCSERSVSIRCLHDPRVWKAYKLAKCDQHLVSSGLGSNLKSRPLPHQTYRRARIRLYAHLRAVSFRITPIATCV